MNILLTPKDTIREHIKVKLADDNFNAIKFWIDFRYLGREKAKQMYDRIYVDTGEVDEEGKPIKTADPDTLEEELRKNVVGWSIEGAEINEENIKKLLDRPEVFDAVTSSFIAAMLGKERLPGRAKN